jgi:hypothetical protein
MTIQELLAARKWKPISNSPGRYVLVRPDPQIVPVQLAQVDYLHRIVWRNVRLDWDCTVATTTAPTDIQRNGGSEIVFGGIGCAIGQPRWLNSPYGHLGRNGISGEIEQICQGFRTNMQKNLTCKFIVENRLGKPSTISFLVGL